MVTKFSSVTNNTPQISKCIYNNSKLLGLYRLSLQFAGELMLIQKITASTFETGAQSERSLRLLCVSSIKRVALSNVVFYSLAVCNHRTTLSWTCLKVRRPL